MITLDPLEWIHRVTMHIPHRGRHCQRFYGAYSNRPRVVKARVEGGSRVLTPILGGWQWTALGRWRSGYPITVTMSGFDAVDSGIPGGEFRPERILRVSLKNPNWDRSNWRTEPYVNPRAFAWPEPGTFGNAARNCSELRSPWFNTLDSSLMKRFTPLRDERPVFESRLEVFNLLNMSVLNMTNGTNVQVLSGNQNILPTNSSTGVPIADQANVQNRYANLRAAGVWDAIIAKAQGVSVDTAIANLPGPGPNGLGCSSNAAELQNRTGTNAFKGSRSPACAARELSMPSNFYRLDQNAVRSRIIQLGLKFYF